MFENEETLFVSDAFLTWDGNNIEDFVNEGFDCSINYFKDSNENGRVLRLFVDSIDGVFCTLNVGDAIRMRLEISKR